MFERFTEKARRVIFFARHEAGQLGSSYIETEHLLLGLLREDKVFHSLLRSPSSAELIRRQIGQRTIGGKTVPASVDLPLSNEGKRVLAYAAEEAEQLSDTHIGTEHLLLGLLREKSGFAAQLLNSEGVFLDGARESISQRKLSSRKENEGLRDTVEIHDEAWDLGYVQTQVAPLGRFAWREREWKPLDILVETGSGHIFFDVTLWDDPAFKLVSGGWAREFCTICHWEISAASSEHCTGYTNGREWLCVECYEKFLKPLATPKG
jgi:hypothetical protein